MSGPMGEGPLPPEEPCNADEPVDDEPTTAIEQGATHFALRVRPNQRKYRGRPRGTARED